MEIPKAPTDTAALSFVANSEAARYVFVVVAAADVMITGRRYGTFVLAWKAGQDLRVVRCVLPHTQRCHEPKACTSPATALYFSQNEQPQ